ncbi:cationic amino acid transporter 2-like [Mytilus trossulus]|uniref:cationic amino acid transporter 2-like n=1 Tax=Mytilus trossulus TaxID=6551 RepID=UPI003003A9A4
MSGFIGKLVRKKYIDISTVTDTKLNRVLNTFDLTALGIGSTLGAGIYVVAGQVAKEKAGPAVVLSFFIAAVASVLAGLCYAEFGARVPKTGSAYVYSYVTVGEFIAFIIGWNLILEYVIGTASVARAWSSYFDSLINKTIQHFFEDNMPMNVGGLSPYPDFFAFGITLLLTCILAIGVKESSTFNNIFTGVNLLVVIYVIVCGAFKADTHNWSLTRNEIGNTTVYGKGGFMPYGFSGMMAGAATCFYAFVGFDCIATTGEEAKNPQKAIPISIVVSLFTIFLAYTGMSIILTLMWPYYDLDSDAPLPEVFHNVGWDVAKYVIAVGAVCGLSTSLLGAMFPLPRVIYAMASDGLVFRFLSNVNKRFQTPLIATFISGLLAGIMAMLFDLQELVDMMSIGTLLAYTLVAVCVLILRYKVKCFAFKHKVEVYIEDGEVQHDSSSKSHLLGNTSKKKENNTSSYLRKMFIRDKNQKTPTIETEKITEYNIAIIVLLVVILSLILVVAEESISDSKPWAIVLAAIFAIAIFVMVYSIWVQPENQDPIHFKVPLLPFLPVISIFINIYLMMKLSTATWIRFAIWMAVGFAIYFGYGIRNSSEGKSGQSVPLLEETSDHED